MIIKWNILIISNDGTGILTGGSIVSALLTNFMALSKTPIVPGHYFLFHFLIQSHSSPYSHPWCIYFPRSFPARYIWTKCFLQLTAPALLSIGFFSYILSFSSSQWSREGHHSVPWFRKEYPWCLLYILSSPFKTAPLTIPPEIIRTLRCHQLPTGILINV